MRIHCLGTTGYHPSPSRQTACYYLPELGLLLDAGTGLFRLIPALRSHPRKDLHILLSHAHLDHVIGLTFLLNVLHATELQQVVLYGQADKLETVRQHLYAELLFPVAPDFDFCPFPATQGQLQIGECLVEYFPLEHPGGSLGYLLSAQDKRMAYITDTVPQTGADWTNRLSNLDVLMHECNFDDSQMELARRTGHSWISAVTQLVEAIRPKQTFLIHINPLAELVDCEFQLSPRHRQLNIRLADDEMVIDV